MSKFSLRELAVGGTVLFALAMVVAAVCHVPRSEVSFPDGVYFRDVAAENPTWTVEVYTFNPARAGEAEIREFARARGIERGTVKKDLFFFPGSGSPAPRRLRKRQEPASCT